MIKPDSSEGNNYTPLFSYYMFDLVQVSKGNFPKTIVLGKLL
jgi:hypothetical protein